MILGILSEQQRETKVSDIEWWQRYRGLAGAVLKQAGYKMPFSAHKTDLYAIHFPHTHCEGNMMVKGWAVEKYLPILTRNYISNFQETANRLQKLRIYKTILKLLSTTTGNVIHKDSGKRLNRERYSGKTNLFSSQPINCCHFICIYTYAYITLKCTIIVDYLYVKCRVW